jgi:hypothetical protein
LGPVMICHEKNDDLKVGCVLMIILRRSWWSSMGFEHIWAPYFETHVINVTPNIAVLLQCWRIREREEAKRKRTLFPWKTWWETKINGLAKEKPIVV